MNKTEEMLAAAAMLRLTDEEAARFSQDLKEIAAAAARLGEAGQGTPPLGGSSVRLVDLRADEAVSADGTRRMLRHSEREENGYVRIARTVGAET